jgi:predicted amidohydrolase YtcJ
MIPPRATTVLTGQVVVSIDGARLETAEAIGLADGCVVVVGARDEVLGGAAPGARIVAAGDLAIIPGIHDFHLHLIGMARARRTVALGGATSFEGLVAAVRDASAALPPDGWLLGWGWSEELLASGDLRRLDEAVGGRPALLHSHDSHSAWASAVAMRAGGLDADAADPPGGRIERRGDGMASGILRESAADPVKLLAERLRGPGLDAALDEVLAELAGFGITGATDAGDSTADDGVGEYAVLGDSASLLLSARARLDGRLRLTVNMPAAAIGAAALLGLRSGGPLSGTTTLRAGWAKAYLDGALGSRTAALHAPYLGAATGERGIARLSPGQIDALVAAGRTTGIGLALHAIGDRAVTLALDALGRAPAREIGVPPDRIEHAQLIGAEDLARFVEADVTASLQPVHVVTDRPVAEEVWADRLAGAYPWRSLASAGARLAFGSDAPIETANPWLGLFAAVHRRAPGEASPDWRAQEALDPRVALGAYTCGPAIGIGSAEEGTLRVGAAADLAVLNVDLGTLLAADERLAAVRAELTLVGGHEVRRA